jgi:predicted nucleic acid-binding protein
VKIVVDSYAWIELFTESLNSDKVEKVLESADDLFTPDIVLAEIARKYIREGFDETTVKVRLQQIIDNSKVTSVNSKLALESAKCYQELVSNARKNKLNSPSLFDALILATARVKNAKILTGDAYFKTLPETIWI